MSSTDLPVLVTAGYFRIAADRYFAGRCKASVPEWMHKAFDRAETAEEAYTLSVAISCEQVDALIGEGVEHLHLYTLNNPDLTFDVCRTLGYVAAPLAFAAEGGGAA